MKSVSQEIKSDFNFLKKILRPINPPPISISTKGSLKGGIEFLERIEEPFDPATKIKLIIKNTMENLKIAFITTSLYKKYV